MEGNNLIFYIITFFKARIADGIVDDIKAIINILFPCTRESIASCIEKMRINQANELEKYRLLDWSRI